MRVRYTPRARADIEAIFSYLISRNPSVARGVKSAIDQAVQLLAFAPHLGAAIDRAPDYRAVRAGRYPYRLYYRIRGDEVWIVHIRHVRQRPWQGE